MEIVVRHMDMPLKLNAALSNELLSRQSQAGLFFFLQPPIMVVQRLRMFNIKGASNNCLRPLPLCQDSCHPF